MTVATGASTAAAPRLPERSRDPVVAIAGAIVSAELTFAGRLAEAVARFESGGEAGIGPLGELPQLIFALALVLAGRGQEALMWVERAGRAAGVLSAGPAALAAAALRAEITSDLDSLPPPPAVAGGLAGALVLRAYAKGGDQTAAVALRSAAADLAMPALVLGI
ncbi:MAG: hypothetical protein ACR2KC_04140 [Acidimicrobiales bacterium]